MLKTASDDIPRCFGSDFLSTDPLCVGGLDPNWNENGSHIRPACDYVSACSSRTQAAKNNTNRPHIPASSLVRPSGTHWHPPSAPTPPPYQPQQYQHTQYAAVPQPFQPVAPGQYPGQHVGIQQVMSANFGIPQYLTTREPSNQGIGRRLFLESVRSIGKSLGHTIAHFFDTEIFGKPPQQPPERK